MISSNGRRIYAVYWPDTETEHGKCMRKDEKHILIFEDTYCGDHNESWIVVYNEDGKETMWYNPRYVDCIVWEENEKGSIDSKY